MYRVFEYVLCVGVRVVGSSASYGWLRVVSIYI